MEFIYILSGFSLLFLGGEVLLKGALDLANIFRISKFFISTVIIGFETSMPEMAVSVGSVIKNSPDIALGNVIGSNIANILLVIGISALINPILINNQSVQKDIFVMLIATIMLVALILLDSLNYFSGILFLVTLFIYLYLSFLSTRKQDKEINQNILEYSNLSQTNSIYIALLISILGIFTLRVGSTLLVDGALSIARSYGISEVIIGLTLVAVGGSLPELAISIIASLKKHGDVVIGNIIGSNIFNILSILGISSIISPIHVSAQIMSQGNCMKFFVSN
jgi:cation:H+ antiporter